MLQSIRLTIFVLLIGNIPEDHKHGAKWMRGTGHLAAAINNILPRDEIAREVTLEIRDFKVKYWSQATMMFTGAKPMLRGSTAENLFLPPWYFIHPLKFEPDNSKRYASDIDIQACDLTKSVPMTPWATSRDSLKGFRLDSTECYPGYTRIADVAMSQREGKVAFYSTKEYRKEIAICNDIHCDSEENWTGAGVTLGGGLKDSGVLDPVYEFVPAIPITGGWPSEMEDIFRRNHPSGWPSESLLKTLKEEPLFLVAKAHNFSKNPELEWRISFSFIEEKLALSLPDSIRHTFLFVKLLFKSTFYTSSPLSSYHLKMLMFTLVERQPRIMWVHNDIASNVLYFLNELGLCLKQKQLKSFFLPESNLLEHFSESELEHVLHDITMFIRNPSNILSQLQTSVHVTTLNETKMDAILLEEIIGECDFSSLTLPEVEQSLRSSLVYQHQRDRGRFQLIVARTLLQLGLTREAQETLQNLVSQMLQVGNVLQDIDKPGDTMALDSRKLVCSKKQQSRFRLHDRVHPIYDSLYLLLKHQLDQTGKYKLLSFKLLENVERNIQMTCLSAKPRREQHPIVLHMQQYWSEGAAELCEELNDAAKILQTVL